MGDDEIHYVNIAVQGCCHGELDVIYNTIAETERSTQQKVDLLIICGDMQCMRHNQDLQSLAVPPKYRRMNSFQQYWSGSKAAPVPTIFIGGNHEASNVLQSLYYGGYVAPNMYYMGFAGVIRFKGLRIGGLSGIFNERHYRCGHYEVPPYSEDTMRSVYHLRELEVYRMLQLASQCDRTDPMDVILSHDWPTDVWNDGDCEKLLRMKPYFRDDMMSGKLGSPPLRVVLQALKPSFWFAAHLHVKFAAVICHREADTDLPITNNVQSARSVDKDEINIDDDDDVTDDTIAFKPPLPPPPLLQLPLPPAVKPVKVTRFLALDKVIPGRYPAVGCCCWCD
jgi:lariat debranching enzyme